MEDIYRLSQTQLSAFDKYPRWSMELKSITDTFVKLNVLASGSSALEIYKGSNNLMSRRSLLMRMWGTSLVINER